MIKTQTVLSRLARVAGALVFIALTSHAQSAFNPVAFEKYVRRLELWLPEVKIRVGSPQPTPYLKGFSEVIVHLTHDGHERDERYYVSDDFKNIVKGEPYDLALSPFQPYVDRLNLDGRPHFGSDGAPVTIVIFGDFQCPYCKLEAEMLRKEIPPSFKGSVTVYFEDFPLETIHPWARTAAVAGRCVFNEVPRLFWEYHDWVYASQQEIDIKNFRSKFLEWAEKTPLDLPTLTKCVDERTTDHEVAASIIEAESLNVSSVPTIFLNGRKVEGAIEWALTKQLIELELNEVRADSGNLP